jgi:hypothetical protein
VPGLRSRAIAAEDVGMSSYAESAAWSSTVLPARVSRRVTRRDGVLPLVLLLELLVGVVFGVVGG